MNVIKVTNRNVNRELKKFDEVVTDRERDDKEKDVILLQKWLRNKRMKNYQTSVLTLLKNLRAMYRSTVMKTTA